MNRTQLEINDQYRALRQTITYIDGRRGEIAAYFSSVKPLRLLYIGCGSSYSIGCSAAMSARRLLGIEANCLPGGDLLLRPRMYEHLLRDALLVPLSRSGETHEIVRAIDAVQALRKTPVLAITCAPESPLSRGAGFSLDLPWAFDESVCQTRSVTNLYAAAQMVSAVLGKEPKIEAELRAIYENGDAYLSRIEPLVYKLAQKDYRNCFVLSDGETCGVAEEAALAMTEIAYTVSLHKHVLDVRHGPVLLIGADSFVLIRRTTEGGDQERALIADIVRRGASVVTCSDMDMDQIEGTYAHLTFGAPLSDATAAIPLLLPMQLLSYQIAVRTGHDPDRPDGLSAWIRLA